MRNLALEIILTACLLGPIQGLSKTEERNTTLSNHGSHYLFKLDSAGTDIEAGKRNSRCTPCGHPDDRQEVTNYLDPEYRGNGADNLGYDWSPWAWGGPAFKNRLNHQGRQYDGWDRGRGSRKMPGNWGGRPENTQPERFNCDRCKVIWERERGSRTNRVGENSFGHRMGQWHDDRGGFRGEIATVTSPPIALRPESRIAYVPSPGGEMYWDGISGGGTRWDGFSNGISWLGGGIRPYDDWRNDPRNRGYGQGPKRPEDYRNNAPGVYHRPWGNEPNKYFPEKGYGNRGPNMDHGMRYNGYASQWHYGITNQNGWNGNNMKWSYGGKNWDNREGHGYYGGTSHGGKFDEDSNPLPHGIEGSNPYGPGADSSAPYGHGSSSTTHGQGGSSIPYGQGSIQYGQGGSIYYDQGNYIFHYGQGGLPHHGYHPSKYPQDGKLPSYPVGRPDQISHSGAPRPSVKPWDYNSNDRYDNMGYSNINWIRPGPTEPGYPKPSSHGKYPFGGYDDKNDRKPWPQRPATGSYTPVRPNSGFPHSGGGYITGSVSHGGDRYSVGMSSQPSGYPGHGEYPGTHHKPAGFPGGGGSGYNAPSSGSGYPGSGGSLEYPSHGEGSGYPGHGGDSGYPGSSGGSGYPGPSGGPVYPSSGGSVGYPGGSGYPRPEHKPGGAGGYPNHRPGGYRPGESGGYGIPEGGHKIPDRPGGYGSGPTPPKGYYMGFITEIDPNKYPNNVNIGLGGNRYPSGGIYSVRDKDSSYGEGQWYGNRYPGIDGDRYPIGGEGYSFGGSNHGGNRYPDDRDRYQPGSSDRFPSGGIFDKGPSVGDEGNAWNYGPEGHKDGIYRRTGGSYPPYRGGPYYTSSYLASASTPAGVSQSPSEGKTQSVTTSDTVTKPTPEST